MVDYKKESEYLKWLGNKMHRKFDGKTFDCFTDGTDAEVQRVLNKLHDEAYYFRTIPETCNFSDGTKRKVTLLYVRRKPYKSLTERGII